MVVSYSTVSSIHFINCLHQSLCSYKMWLLQSCICIQKLNIFYHHNARLKWEAQFFFLWHVWDKDVLLLEIKHASISFTSFPLTDCAGELPFVLPHCPRIGTAVNFCNYFLQLCIKLIGAKFCPSPYMHTQSHSTTSTRVLLYSNDLGSFLPT